MGGITLFSVLTLFIKTLNFLSIMSDKQYDSVLVGYAEDPRYNDDGVVELECPIQGHRAQEMIEKYATSRNEQGQGR